METITTIISLIIGGIIFLKLNKTFEIQYFGCFGIIGMWLTCVAIGYAIIHLLNSVVMFIFSGGLIVSVITFIIIYAVLYSVYKLSPLIFRHIQIITHNKKDL